MSFFLTSLEFFFLCPAPLLGRLFELHHVAGHVHWIPGAGVLTSIRDHVRFFNLQNEAIRVCNLAE